MAVKYSNNINKYNKKTKCVSKKAIHNKKINKLNFLRRKNFVSIHLP